MYKIHVELMLVADKFNFVAIKINLDKKDRELEINNKNLLIPKNFNRFKLYFQEAISKEE